MRAFAIVMGLSFGILNALLAVANLLAGNIGIASFNLAMALVCLWGAWIWFYQHV